MTGHPAGADISGRGSPSAFPVRVRGVGEPGVVHPGGDPGVEAERPTWWPLRRVGGAPWGGRLPDDAPGQGTSYFRVNEPDPE